MEKSKKVRMPAGIRNKLTAAVAMLLVSSIMMVSSTYAWFTLSTAPEVTGITTSVGANGNLEMALLNGRTYDNTGLINSAVGSSTAAAGTTVEESNITWGNLVDLSAASYGLNLIALNPAALNLVDGKLGTTLLKTAEYGADGRVTELEDNTITGVYNSTNAKWVTTQTFEGVADPLPAYGVRAIGVDSNMTTAQIVFNAAVSAVNSGVRGASSAVSSAIGANQLTFLTLAMSLGGGSTKEAYNQNELDALKAVAQGVETSLNTIVKTYANAVLAKLATTEGVTDELLTELRGQLSNMTSASELSTVLTTASVTNDYTARLANLADAQGKVAAVLAHFDGKGEDDYTTTTSSDDIKTNVVTPLIGNTVVAEDAEGNSVAPSMDTVSSIKNIYVTGGLVSVVAADAGTYTMCKLTDAFDLTVYAGAKGTTSKLAEVKNTVNDLTPPSGENAETTIADFYGYIIDFAFRTNAANSNLQLQTSAVNRVYSDAEGENLATQGSGSTATFVFDSTLLTEAQVNSLLGAINLVFLNPTDGTIYGTAKLTEVVVEGGEATAKVRMVNHETSDVATITPLQQNQATKVSVLVYMDGEQIDNSDVANSTSSGMLNLNLQFSSSAELIPMQNTALEQMTAYTVSFNANGGFGYMSDVKASGTYTAPTAPNYTAPTGKVFKGWAKTATISADTELVTTLTLEENVTLYAIWQDDPNAGEE